MPIPTLTKNRPGERLTEFYRKLGWDEKSVLDPTRVKITERDWRDIISNEIAHAKAIIDINELDIRVGIGMLWTNTGPSGGGKTPGKVELHPGWIS